MQGRILAKEFDDFRYALPKSYNMILVYYITLTHITPIIYKYLLYNITFLFNYIEKIASKLF